jgi:hypothetical protein
VSTTATAPTVSAVLSPRLLLAGEPVEAADRLAGELQRNGVARTAFGQTRRLSSAAAGLVDREIGAVLSGLLELDLGDVLLAGWRGHRALVAAGQRTAADPAGREVVDLASHRVRWASRPAVDLVLDGVRLATLEFALDVEFVLVGVAAVVWRGYLVAAQGGDCTVTGQLSFADVPLLRNSWRVDVAWLVRLDPAVPLVDAEPAR